MLLMLAASLLARTPLGAPGIATRNKKLLGSYLDQKYLTHLPERTPSAPRLTTESASGDALDGTLTTLRYVASDTMAQSFGVYRLAMAPGQPGESSINLKALLTNCSVLISNSFLLLLVRHLLLVGRHLFLVAFLL